MSEYIKKSEFFELDIDSCILQGKDYKLERLSSKAMKLFIYDKNNQLEYIKIQYVNTIILSHCFHDNTIKLNNGGWFTKTTKDHINKYLYGYGFGISQYQYNWYILKNGNCIKSKKHLRELLEKWSIKNFSDYTYIINLNK